MVISYDPSRFNNVLAKIAKGLYFLEYNEILPSETKFFVEKIIKQEVLTLLEKMTRAGTHDWKEIFRYSYGRVEQNHEQSIWILEFYQTDFYAVITGLQAPLVA